MALSRNVQQIIYSVVISGSILLLNSCQYFKSDHPQAELINQSTTTGMTEESVIAFAEEMEHSKDNLKKLSSLVYKRGQENFFVEHYFTDHGNQIFIEHQHSETTMEGSSRRFYLKNDSLILVTASNSLIKGNEKIYSESRTYLRNYTIFKRESKQANNAATLTAAVYQDQDIKQHTEDYKAAIERLQDALERRGAFDLVFDKITEYPDASFLELKSKTPNGYAASIEIRAKDAFVDSLLRDPMHFRNNKIDFNWTVKDMEAVYEPSGSTSTSANGLNR